jgi:hypothetical protein
MRCCAETGIIPAFISIGAAAALHCYIGEMGLAQTPETATQSLSEISALPKNSAESGLILSMYSMLLEKAGLSELYKAAMLAGNQQVI